jgi:6-methylsalicylate decarboxylase
MKICHEKVPGSTEPRRDSGHGVSRREILRALGVGAAAIPAMGELFAQAANSKVNKLTAIGGAIDVHHHHQPPGLGGRGGTGGRGGAGAGGAGGGPAAAANAGGGRGGRTQWTPEYSIEQMDKFGIATSILSMTQMGDILYDGTEKGRSAVRTGNEYGAKMMHDYPTRFGLFASVPLPDIDGCLKEIEYAYDSLKCDGIGIYTNDNGNRWPGDPYYEPMYHELNRRKAIVFIHPLAPRCCTNLPYGVPFNMNEFDFDVTRCVTSLLANGVLHRYPEVRFIVPHSGGTLPVLAGRIQNRYPNDAKHAEYIPNGVWPELQKLYYEVAHGTYPMQLAALTKFVQPSQLLFGTDFSPEPIETTVDNLPTSGLSPTTLQAMERGNAEKLLPRFKVKA